MLNIYLQLLLQEKYPLLNQVFFTKRFKNLLIFIVYLYIANEFILRKKQKIKGESVALPLITGACPGWICYAEKTHGNMIIPHLSEIKSPQQVTF